MKEISPNGTIHGLKTAVKLHEDYNKGVKAKVVWELLMEIIGANYKMTGGQVLTLFRENQMAFQHADEELHKMAVESLSNNEKDNILKNNKLPIKETDGVS